jgi:hypothetical protein
VILIARNYFIFMKLSTTRVFFCFKICRKFLTKKVDLTSGSCLLYFRPRFYLVEWWSGPIDEGLGLAKLSQFNISTFLNAIFHKVCFLFHWTIIWKFTHIMKINLVTEHTHMVFVFNCRLTLLKLGVLRLTSIYLWDTN